MHGRNGLQFGVFMYPQHIQNGSNFGHGLLIFLVLALILLSETGQIWGFRVFLEERMEEMAWNGLHADVSWPPSELISL